MSTEPLLKKKWTIDDMDDQTGKIILITGGNSGLGFEAGKALARKNAEVILTSRNMERGEEAVQEILEEVPNADINVMQLDLANLNSVDTFAAQFSEKFSQLHVLINNAGIMQPPKTKTEDGFELQIGVNHFGHFALTAKLFDLLKKTPHSRIINQSSLASNRGKMNFDDINSEKKYSRTGAYSQSKLANILFTYELDRQIKDHNLEIISVAVHPGYTATNLQHNGPTQGGKSMWSRLYTITNKLMAQNVSKGILPMLYAATAKDVNGGDYIGPRNFGQTRGYPRRLKSSKLSYIQEDWKKLWKISETATKIEFDFS